MNKINDGGPAFPLQGKIVKQYQPTGLVTGESLQGYQPGMSLRDYFAIHASDKDIENVIDAYADYDSGIPQDVITRPEARYIYADAMIAAREAGK